jgi:hypothetical protein
MYENVPRPTGIDRSSAFGCFLAASHLEIFTGAQSTSFLEYLFGARGFGGRHAPMMSPRQLKEVIQVAHTNVGSVATLGALVGGEVHR